MHFSKPDDSYYSVDELKLLNSQNLAVVVPCYNEENNVRIVVETMPDFVECIVLVNDASTDSTSVVLKELEDEHTRVVTIELLENEGVGGAIAAGYKYCNENGVFAAAVMAGDAQMDPYDLHQLFLPVLKGEANYVKGNRLLFDKAIDTIPKVRFFGNAGLSLLTKFASGYWDISDTQCGYTVVDHHILKTMNWDKMYKRYGQPNDLLIKLNIHDFVVRDILVKPVYNVGENSGIAISRVIFTISNIIFRGAIKRLFLKYVIYDFHPLILFFLFGLFTFLGSLYFMLVLLISYVLGEEVRELYLICGLFLFSTSFNSLFFSMWLDMEENKKLRAKTSRWSSYE